MPVYILLFSTSNTRKSLWGLFSKLHAIQHCTQTSFDQPASHLRLLQSHNASLLPLTFKLLRSTWVVSWLGRFECPLPVYPSLLRHTAAEILVCNTRQHPACTPLTRHADFVYSWRRPNLYKVKTQWNSKFYHVEWQYKCPGLSVYTYGINLNHYKENAFYVYVYVYQVPRIVFKERTHTMLSTMKLNCGCVD